MVDGACKISPINQPTMAGEVLGVGPCLLLLFLGRTTVQVVTSSSVSTSTSLSVLVVIVGFGVFGGWGVFFAFSAKVSFGSLGALCCSSAICLSFGHLLDQWSVQAQCRRCVRRPGTVTRRMWLLSRCSGGCPSPCLLGRTPPLGLLFGGTFSKRPPPSALSTIFLRPPYLSVGGSQCTVARTGSFSSSSMRKKQAGSRRCPVFPCREGGPTTYQRYGSSALHTCRVDGAAPVRAPNCR